MVLIIIEIFVFYNILLNYVHVCDRTLRSFNRVRHAPTTQEQRLVSSSSVHHVLLSFYVFILSAYVLFSIFIILCSCFCVYEFNVYALIVCMLL